MFDLMMVVVLGIVSLALISIHIYGCKSTDPRFRRYSKPFLVPSMTAFTYALMSLNGLSLPFGIPFLIAMAFYTIGDILLMAEKKENLFLWGMVSFIIGHITVAVSFMSAGIKLLYLIIASVIWFAVLVFLFFPRLDPKNSMTSYLKGYGTMIALYGIVVSASTFNGNALSHVLAIFGVMMFGISDCMIALRITDGKNRSTRVMVTYILAVALLLTSAYFMAI